VGAGTVRVSADAGLVARTNALASLPSPASQPSGSVALLTASGWPLLLYPMALLGASSVLLALTLINWTLLATFAALATGGLRLQLGGSRTWEWAAGALAVSLALAELLGLALLRRVAGSW
jgi:hypothetical protein